MPPASAAFAAEAAPWERQAYSADAASIRYVPFDAINRDTVERLETAWELEKLPSGHRAQGNDAPTDCEICRDKH